jgi:hypothetical protein
VLGLILILLFFWYSSTSSKSSKVNNLVSIRTYTYQI